MSNALNERQKALLDLLLRYRILLASLVLTLLCDGSESIAKKLLLNSRDFVASDPLGPKTVYYRLTAAGAKLLGAPEEISRPLGPQALPRALGVLGFCTAAKTRQRFLRHEFQKDFPELAGALLTKDYHTDFFLDHDGAQARIGQIVVDQGGDYKKTISKCRVRLREFLDVPGLRDIIDHGLFTFAFVVAEAEKAQAIRLGLAEKPLRARVLVETSAELQKCPLQGGFDA